jgi:DNA-binding transcriptional LysR family regulator
VLSDRTLDLLEENIGLAVRIGKLPDSSLIAARIGSTRIVACASPGYLAAHGKPDKPEELSDHHCVTFDNLGSPEVWRFSNASGDSSVPIRSRLCVNTAEAAIDAAVAGIGVLRMMSYKVEDARRRGELEFILENYEPEPWAITVIYPGQGSPPHKLRAFLNFATPRLRARIA